ncbi:MAG: replication initiator protein [Arizlama microvirus]|nr:MAG: replication initiator protein [Arizlama microvirus]
MALLFPIVLIDTTPSAGVSLGGGAYVHTPKSGDSNHGQTLQNPQQNLSEILHQTCTLSRQKHARRAHARRHPPLGTVPCYSPLKGFRSLDGVEKGGKPRIVFTPLKAINSTQPISIPCGQCIGCRIRKVEDWGTRIAHEAQMHSRNSFLTLTYAPENMPWNGSVSKREAQLFMKRLRKEIETKIRFFTCGEYGDKSGHPHYHSIIFGYDFSGDRVFHKLTDRGDRLYTSAQLEKVWPYGHALIGDVTPQSGAYVAGYVTKKIGGEPAAAHYSRVHPFRDEVHQVEPEFALQSRRPGLGFTWYEKHKADAFPSDFIVIDGKERAVPRYYTLKLQQHDQTITRHLPAYDLTLETTLSKEVKRTRIARATATKANSTPDRLAVREFIKKDRLSRLKREL